MLSVPKDQLRAEDGGDAGRRGGLQRHHPLHALLAARRLQQGALPHGGAGQVPARRSLVRIRAAEPAVGGARVTGAAEAAARGG